MFDCTESLENFNILNYIVYIKCLNIQSCKKNIIILKIAQIFQKICQFLLRLYFLAILVRECFLIKRLQSK